MKTRIQKKPRQEMLVRRPATDRVDQQAAVVAGFRSL